MLALPEILFEEKNKGTWELNGWKPVAKPDAPEEVKQAIDSFVAEADSEEDDGDSMILM